MGRRKRLVLPALLALGAVLACVVLPAYRAVRRPAEATVFAMDTVMSLTLYGGWDRERTKETRDWMVEKLNYLDELLSPTGDSALSALNREGTARLPQPAAELLDQALALCEQTGGALDITAYPAVRAWGFLDGAHRVPDGEELARLAGRIDYTAVEVEGDTVTLPAGVELDLGAVAKGYAGDLLAASARSSGISSALIDLGQSTIVAVGTKPGGSPWRIGILDPAGERYFAVLELADLAMGTSGGYQRYFEQDGTRYWHILDPATAAPARSGLASVTVVDESGLRCDGLSTALFVMGREEAAAFWREHRDFEMVLVDEAGDIYVTAGLQDRFSLAGGYEDREVTILA